MAFGNPLGTRCSSVVRAFAHGAMGRRIDPYLSDAQKVVMGYD